MSFDYTPSLSTYAQVYEEIKVLVSISDFPWTLIHEHLSGSFTLNTTAGSEVISDKFAVFRIKTSGNNAGTEDIKYSYAIVQHDTSNNRLIVRTCESFSAAGVNVNVTPLASSVILGLTNFNLGVGVLCHQDSFSIQIINTLNNAKFAAVCQLEGLGFSGTDLDKRFCLIGNTSYAWCLATSLYSEGEYDLQCIVPSGLNVSEGSFLLFPVALNDSLADDKFLGSVTGSHVIDNVTADVIDIIESGTDWYRIFFNSSDSRYFVLKEGLAL